MFNVKALLWTAFAAWIFGSTYWYVCKIRQLCDLIYNPRLFPTEVVSDNGEVIPTNNIQFLHYPLDARLVFQMAVMLLVALLLGYLIANSYGKKKTTDLKYKLSRIDREIRYYQLKE